jgi:hypothetical protein
MTTNLETISLMDDNHSSMDWIKPNFRYLARTLSASPSSLPPPAAREASWGRDDPSVASHG